MAKALEKIVLCVVALFARIVRAIRASRLSKSIRMHRFESHAFWTKARFVRKAPLQNEIAPKIFEFENEM